MRKWMMVGALASAVSVGACERGPDVEKMADGALERAALNDKVDAEYDESARVVRLSGTVDSADQRARAADAVRASSAPPATRAGNSCWILSPLILASSADASRARDASRLEFNSAASRCPERT